MKIFKSIWNFFSNSKEAFGKHKDAVARVNVVMSAFMKQRTIQFSHKNHRGEISVRKVMPYRLEFTSNEYYPEEQYILFGFDLDKQDERGFALKNIGTNVFN